MAHARRLTEQQPEGIAATLFLLVVAVMFAGVAEGGRSREALADRAEDRRQLLQRTLDQDQVAAFVRQEAQRDAYAEDAALLLRTDTVDGWRLLAADQSLTVPAVAAGTPPRDESPGWAPSQDQTRHSRESFEARGLRMPGKRGFRTY